MIEIEDNAVKIKDISRLFGPNPINAIFDSLVQIWNPDLRENPEEYYFRGESLTSKFEGLIFKIFPEVYDEIIRLAEKNNTIAEILAEKSFCLVIMDGMSLREGILVGKNLEELEVRLEYTFSAIPSETKFYTEKYFKSGSPSQIRGDNFEFVHIQREDKIGDVSLDAEKLVIWSIYPDNMFSEFRSGFEAVDLRRIGDMTVSIVTKLVNHLCDGYDEIIITSDHGYFVDSFAWDGLRDFPSGERYSAAVPDHLKKYCKYVNDNWVLIGRYNTIKKGKYTHVRHGGLSFLECIVPLIRVRC